MAIHFKRVKHKPQVSVENPLLLSFGLRVAHSKSSKQHRMVKSCERYSKKYLVPLYKEILTKLLKSKVLSMKFFCTAHIKR
jgi:hypothetical protein